MALANPCGGGRKLAVPPWAGPIAWLEEIERQARVMQCRSGHHRRWEATARQLTAWRVRSPVQCSAAALEPIAPLLEECRRDPGRRLLGVRSAWSDAELGLILMELRNRLELAKLGRDRARIRNPRFDLERIPSDRLEALIQRHPNLELVDRLRAERLARISRAVSVPLAVS